MSLSLKLQIQRKYKIYFNINLVFALFILFICMLKNNISCNENVLYGKIKYITIERLKQNIIEKTDKSKTAKYASRKEAQKRLSTN